jgi:hypothetical protein
MGGLGDIADGRRVIAFSTEELDRSGRDAFLAAIGTRCGIHPCRDDAVNICSHRMAFPPVSFKALVRDLCGFRGIPLPGRYDRAMTE